MEECEVGQDQLLEVVEEQQKATEAAKQAAAAREQESREYDAQLALNAD